MSAKVEKGIYAILFSRQYSSSLRPLRANKTSASRAAARSDTPSPTKQTSGQEPSSLSDDAVVLYSWIEAALSCPRGVSCSQIGFQLDPSGVIVASLAIISMC